MEIARGFTQLGLLDVMPLFDIPSNAHARNAYGAAAQEIVCKALDLDPIPIDGRCRLCFDAERRKIFYEIKSVYAGSKIVLYDWRMKKEEGAGVPLFYAILVHKVRRARSSLAMWQAFQRSPLELLILPAAAVHSLARKEPLNTIKKLNSDPRHGYNRGGYKEGYRNLSVGKAMELTATGRTEAFSLHGLSFKISIREAIAIPV